MYMMAEIVKILNKIVRNNHNKHKILYKEKLFPQLHFS